MEAVCGNNNYKVYRGSRMTAFREPKEFEVWHNTGDEENPRITILTHFPMAAAHQYVQTLNIPDGTYIYVKGKSDKVHKYQCLCTVIHAV